MKDAVSREAELWKTTYEQERKSSKWYTPYKYDLPSLKALSQSISTEKIRLKEIDIATITKVNSAISRLMKADLKAGKDAEELKKMGEAIMEGESAAANGAISGSSGIPAVAAVAVGATARDPAAGTGCTTGATCPAVTGVAAGTAGLSRNTRSGTRRACHAIATVAAESSGTTGTTVTALGVSTCRKTCAAGSALATGSTLAASATVGSGRARVTGLRAIGTVVACRSGSAVAALTG
jgi:hypothetical protein